MPITVACTCGKKLKAPDKLAGSRVKCPGCGSILKVPAEAPSTAAAETPAQAAPDAPLRAVAPRRAPPAAPDPVPTDAPEPPLEPTPDTESDPDPADAPAAAFAPRGKATVAAPPGEPVDPSARKPLHPPSGRRVSGLGLAAIVVAGFAVVVALAQVFFWSDKIPAARRDVESARAAGELMSAFAPGEPAVEGFKSEIRSRERFIQTIDILPYAAPALMVVVIVLFGLHCPRTAGLILLIVVAVGGFLASQALQAFAGFAVAGVLALFAVPIPPNDGTRRPENRAVGAISGTVVGMVAVVACWFLGSMAASHITDSRRQEVERLMRSAMAGDRGGDRSGSSDPNRFGSSDPDRFDRGDRRPVQDDSPRPEEDLSAALPDEPAFASKGWDIEALTAAGKLPAYEAVLVVPVRAAIAETALSADGTLMAIDSNDAVHVIDIKARRRRHEVLVRSAHGLALSPAGQMLAVGSGDHGATWIIDLSSGKMVRNLETMGRTLIFGPQGRTLVVVATDERIEHWDAQTGRRLMKTEIRADADRLTTALSPDGNRLCFRGRDRGAHVLDLKTGDVKALPKPEEQVEALAWSSDGTRIVGTTDKKIHVWDAATGNELQSFKSSSGRARPIFSAAGKLYVVDHGVIAPADDPERKLSHLPDCLLDRATPDGTLLLTSRGLFSDEGWIIWRATATRETWGATVGENSGRPAIAPDGKRIAIRIGEEIRVFDDAGKPLKTIPDADRTYGLAFSVDGEVLWAAANGELRRWNSRTGEAMEPIRGVDVESLVLRADGSPIALGKRSLHFCDAAAVREVGLAGEVNAAAVSPDGKLLAVSLRRPDRIELRKAADGELIRALPRTREAASCLEFTPDSTGLTFNMSGVQFTWNLNDDRPDSLVSSTLAAVLHSPDGKLACAIESDGRTRIRDRATGRLLGIVQTGGKYSESVVRARAADRFVTLSENRLAVWDFSRVLEAVDEGFEVKLPKAARRKRDVPSAEDKELQQPTGSPPITPAMPAASQLWTVGEGKAPTYQVLRRIPTKAYHTALSADGTRAVVWSSDEIPVEVFEVATGKSIRQYQGKSPGARLAAISPDGRLLAVCFKSDDFVTVLDVASGAPIRRIPNRADVLAFGPDGTSLLRVLDGFVETWSLMQPARTAVFDLGVDTGYFSSAKVAFSPDGKRVAAVEREASNLLDLATGDSADLGKGLRGAAFSTDGKLLATSATDLMIIRDAASGKEVRRHIVYGGDTVVFAGTFVAACGGGLQLLSTDGDGAWGIFERASYRHDYSSPSASHDGRTLAVIFAGELLLLRASEK